MQKKGSCLVRKKDTTELTPDGIEKRSVHEDDTVVMVKDGVATTVKRYTVGTRRAEYVKHREMVENADLNQLYNTTDGRDEYIVPDGEGESFATTAEAFPAYFIFTETILNQQNTPAHKVDYFVSCPCNPYDFGPSKHFEEFTSQGMTEYWNR